MHGKIFQIGRKPIDKEDYASPDMYYDNSSDFADYIGDAVDEEGRNYHIGWLGNQIKDVFTPVGDGVFAYKGEKALQAFKQEWADEIKKLTDGLTGENLFRDGNLYHIRAITKETHVGSAYRFDIGEWCDGVAYPFGELFEYAACKLKEGDRIYVGAIIDYHS